MKKLIYLGVLMVLSCVESKKMDSVEKGYRELIVYDLDNLIRENEYELTRTENDSSIVFEYKNPVDFTKNMAFHYLKQENKINFGPEKFSLTEKKFLSKDLEFDKYEAEPIPDGMGPVLFNSDYGILAFDNGWGMQFHFLTKKNKMNFELPILYDYSETDK